MFSTQARAAASDGPVFAPAPERVVFHTVAGDLVFGLDAQGAPQTAAQFLKLARAGVYDGNAFVRSQPGFYLQLGNPNARSAPLTAEQAALLHPLPLEASALKHVRGMLSMTHKPGEPNSGQSGFVILLGPAPQLDGSYTIFGALVSGYDVLDELAAAPRDAQGKPMVRLEVTRAEVIANPTLLSQMKLAAAHPIPGVPANSAASALLRGAAAPRGSAQSSVTGRDQDLAIAAGIFLMVLLAIASALLRGRISPRHLSSIDLVIVLIGSFLLFVLLFPEGQRRGWLAAVLFFGIIGVLKLLGRFEAAEK